MFASWIEVYTFPLHTYLVGVACWIIAQFSACGPGPELDMIGFPIEHPTSSCAAEAARIHLRLRRRTSRPPLIVCIPLTTPIFSSRLSFPQLRKKICRPSAFSNHSPEQ